MVPSAIRPIRRASVGASTRLAAMVRPSALSRREISPISQLATSLGLPLAFAAVSKNAAVALSCVISVAS